MKVREQPIQPLERIHFPLLVVQREPGKTFLAVAELIACLKSGKVQKGIISRPTVEAGKPIGYLPGGIKEKLDPFVRPIYDNMEYFLGPEQTKSLINDGIIEIVPFQFLRGRTFSDSFIILDETQNATREQLKLALTRIGFGSKCVVTYDEAQCDIKRETSCIIDIPKFDLQEDIGYYRFDKKDIVRSPIVRRVLDIYDDLD